jgi:hypothetical protein
MQNEMLVKGLFPVYNQWVFGASQNLSAYQNWTTTHSTEYAAFNKYLQDRNFKIPAGQYYH